MTFYKRQVINNPVYYLALVFYTNNYHDYNYKVAT